MRKINASSSAVVVGVVVAHPSIVECCPFCLSGAFGLVCTFCSVVVLVVVVSVVGFTIEMVGVGVGDSFSYSRTGKSLKSFKCRSTAAALMAVVVVPPDVIDTVVRLDFDVLAQRHLCDEALVVVVM